MKLVVGLGNPGQRYDGTRHNVGFDVVDELVMRMGLKFTQQKFQADYIEVNHHGEKTIFLKPFTYMNLSGEAVLPMMSYFGVGLEDLLVIYDDLDISVGQLRLRPKGSAGGHNGMKNIIQMLGQDEFKRLKIGIGRPKPGWKVSDHVLAPFDKEDREVVQEAVHKAADAVEVWLEGQTFEEVMTQYNQKA